MRLVCPNCRAHYEVDDDAIPEGGRSVQCSACGETWFQPREPAQDQDEQAESAENPEQSGATPEETAPLAEQTGVGDAAEPAATTSEAAQADKPPAASTTGEDLTGDALAALRRALGEEPEPEP
ncbi:MAG: zinc-ribbon domain-containing protein, partial [Paracoccaceae bacterium]|nr:zinc-ribbon domain-containing protein [Paracoccaceae bacterium]